MARIRSAEFVSFVRTNKKHRFGALTMVDNEVRSYNTVIATVDRVNKVVTINPAKYSVTTTIHQHAAMNGMHYLPEFTVQYLSA